MKDMLARVWMNLGDRVGGPMTFRIILQPTMAALLALLAGLKDAREGRHHRLFRLSWGRLHHDGSRPHRLQPQRHSDRAELLFGDVGLDPGACLRLDHDVRPASAGCRRNGALCQRARGDQSGCDGQQH